MNGDADARQGDESVLRARAARLARPVAEATDVDLVDIIPFTVAGQRYGVPANSVRQVRRLTELARLPRSPMSLLGVTRIRSAVVPVFDVAALLGLVADATQAREWVVVLGDDDRPDLGIAAESVDGIRTVSHDDIGDPPAGGHGAVGTWGITSDGVTVLDAPLLLDAPAVFAAAHGQPAVPLGTRPRESADAAAQRGNA